MRGPERVGGRTRRGRLEDVADARGENRVVREVPRGLAVARALEGAGGGLDRGNGGTDVVEPPRRLVRERIRQTPVARRPDAAAGQPREVDARAVPPRHRHRRVRAQRERVAGGVRRQGVAQPSAGRQHVHNALVAHRPMYVAARV